MVERGGRRAKHTGATTKRETKHCDRESFCNLLHPVRISLKSGEIEVDRNVGILFFQISGKRISDGGWPAGGVGGGIRARYRFLMLP